MRTSILQRRPTSWKLFLVLATLYLFLVGIGGMSGAIKSLGKGGADALLGSTTSPIVALFLGILITTLVQSSSTSTSMIVGSVVGGIIDVRVAMFMVMGANVGTTVTNTIVSLGHITRSNEYQRAFAAATVHDFFNVVVLCVIFPLEALFGPLSYLATALTDSLGAVGIQEFANPIKIVTQPARDLIRAIAGIAPSEASRYWVELCISVALMFSMLISLVKCLKALMIERLENLFDRTIFKTASRALIFGLVLTTLVQSSSVTTSLAVPLVGAGILTVRQIFPYTMGANIGTTCTGILAAFGAMADAAPGDATVRVGLTVALFHVMFNIAGVALVWPIRELPVRLAEGFARLAMKNRIIPVVYILVAFYLVPLLVVVFGRQG